MGRRILKSIEDYSRALKDGYGLGVGADYLPWLRVNDTSSRGKSVKIHGLKTDRTHQLLSGNEENFFYCAEFYQRVIDIREQFPLLPLDLIVRLSREAGIKYPINQDSKDPCVLSTDFLLTLEDSDQISYLAVAIKLEKDLQDKDVLARLEIERLLFMALEVPWRLVTDRQIDKQISRNIKWFSDPLRGRKQLSLGNDKDRLIDEIATRLKPGVYQWEGLVDQWANVLGQDSKLISSVLKAAIWLHRINVDITTPIQEQGLIHILGVEVEAQEDTDYGSVG